MTSERELKLVLEDRAGLRERLQGEGARRLHAESFEDNTLWDRDDSLQAGGCLLRLRQDGQGVRLTFKGPASFADGVKIRTEHETMVEDRASVAAILGALGYAPARRYQKYREEWQLEGVLVALDRTPMGDYVEFEGTTASAIALRCGCDPKTALAADYLTLYDAFRARHPEAPSDMLFVESEAGDG